MKGCVTDGQWLWGQGTWRHLALLLWAMMSFSGLGYWKEGRWTGMQQAARLCHTMGHDMSRAFVKGSNFQGQCEKVRPLGDAEV